MVSSYRVHRAKKSRELEKDEDGETANEATSRGIVRKSAGELNEATVPRPGGYLLRQKVVVRKC